MRLTCGPSTACQSGVRSLTRWAAADRTLAGQFARACLDRRPSRGHTLAYPLLTRHPGQAFAQQGVGAGQEADEMAKTMKPTEQTEVSEAQIAVHWKEEAYYQPSEQFKAQAYMRDPLVFARFGLDKFPDCFREYAEMLTWF